MSLNKQEAGYDIIALQNGIEKCKKNIKIFKEAISREHETISHYRYIIGELEKQDK